MPEQTILIENPVAVTEDASSAAKGFVDFLLTDEAQKVFGDEGYRPVSKPSSTRLTSDAGVALHDCRFRRLGDRSEEFFDRETGFMADVQRELGQPTGS